MKKKIGTILAIILTILSIIGSFQDEAYANNGNCCQYSTTSCCASAIMENDTH